MQAFYREARAYLTGILIVSAYDILIVSYTIIPAHAATIVLLSLTDGSLTYCQAFSPSRSIMFWMELKGQCQEMRLNISSISIS